ncbi:host attachment protein [Phenylobacterium sp. LH3H17]|uniref:host attachment protein n=1 Tax=Phenylobacterium sp. LH3H17 TaxID=2903901 RepID=UPI0020C961B5|nr:host attachment protein [Phenylobacterium sp. LH3H17]UTP41177.1 host attachment protein [Phenylobacterium sp. LH3H17]
MDEFGVTWIVTADAVEARFFSEPVRAGALRELPDLRMTASNAERGAGRRQGATVHQRVGAGRHGAGERSPEHEAERRFMTRVATRLMVSAGRGDFDRLVLMGPPHALGALKSALPASVAARLEVTDPHERKQDDAESLRRHLREARARA